MSISSGVFDRKRRQHGGVGQVPDEALVRLTGSRGPAPSKLQRAAGKPSGEDMQSRAMAQLGIVSPELSDHGALELSKDTRHVVDCCRCL